jgi:hypothetical protein
MAAQVVTDMRRDHLLEGLDDLFRYQRWVGLDTRTGERHGGLL